MVSINIALFAALDQLLGDTVPYLLIYIIVYACVLFVSFNIYRHRAFYGKNKYVKSILEYFVATQVNFWAGGFSLLWFLVEVFGLSAIASQLLFISVSAPLMFLIAKKRIFT